MTVFWHRRDLRLDDNRGLERALERSEDPIVPLFVLDPTVLEHASPVRVACLLEAVGALRERYRDLGSDLVIRRGKASAVVPGVAADVGSERVVWNRDYSGLAADRDRAVVAALEDDDVTWESVHDAICHEPGSITPNEGTHYQVFSYFWKKWRDRDKRDPVAPPEADLLATVGTDGDEIGGVETGTLPSRTELGFESPEASLPTVTPAAARTRLETFCDGPIYQYADVRDLPAAGGTSRLSIHLAWGTIGVRDVWAATERAADRAGDGQRESVTAFQRQLAWREFYAHVLAFNPEIVTEDFDPYPDEIPWRDDTEALEAWKHGRTGFPIVDAGMRQLREEAWMHNRVRMLVASFLTKHLLLDWRHGYDWFRRHLADHDTANDVGGWQWAASTGTDAQPYFRVFNPISQCQEYDPDGEYVRRYVPELEDVPTDAIHDWPELEQADRDRLAPDYPDPIVDHAAGRTRAIEAFERARGE
ncbi:cryptochrome/photolyase family protein [Natrarchaeobaculum aegyptiacum]|uniref:Deoxyribodipyrimidine photolyase n=1 Tax=Natrarchaeobaculum aegyptiacum TaxID=745377 RepID=A0A2Z2HSF2_9EURY|nr:deoxyribodipyrimidine photo-lyase [Natrarchaeobaculum aegyptiacum]ARS88307.1 deoxyribodipyrimidine photolyase [Natrarchaeobaculum aegyptiacum]